MKKNQSIRLQRIYSIRVSDRNIWTAAIVYSSFENKYICKEPHFEDMLKRNATGNRLCVHAPDVLDKNEEELNT